MPSSSSTTLWRIVGLIAGALLTVIGSLAIVSDPAEWRKNTITLLIGLSIVLYNGYIWRFGNFVPRPIESGNTCLLRDAIILFGLGGMGGVVGIVRGGGYLVLCGLGLVGCWTGGLVLLRDWRR